MNAALPLAKCKVCAKEYQRARPLQSVCSFRCASKTVTAKKQAEKEERRADRKKLIAMKPHGKWLQEAQAAFNYYVRMRDAHLPCISCQRVTGCAWDAGHYLSRGARPELRFNEKNCWRQCVACNQHLHGNLILYRVELVKRLGIEEVEKLEGPHPPAKWSNDELKVIRDGYRLMAKTLKECM